MHEVQDLGLAVRALSDLQTASRHQHQQPVHLVLAGGYDSRLAENREVFEELHQLVAALGLQSQVRHLMKRRFFFILLNLLYFFKNIHKHASS